MRGQSDKFFRLLEQSCHFAGREVNFVSSSVYGMESRIVQEFNYFQINTLPRFKVYNGMETVRGEIYEDRPALSVKLHHFFTQLFFRKSVINRINST